MALVEQANFVLRSGDCWITNTFFMTKVKLFFCSDFSLFVFKFFPLCKTNIQIQIPISTRSPFHLSFNTPHDRFNSFCHLGWG
jgi:hypothetical protein